MSTKVSQAMDFILSISLSFSRDFISDKKAVIEAKLEDLEGNEVFQKELAEKLQAYSQHKITRKNVLENTDIEVDGSVWIGDNESDSDNVFDEKIL